MRAARSLGRAARSAASDRRQNPRVELKFDSIRIYFGALLHLSIRRSELFAVQSWRRGAANYFIEYTARGGAAVLTEYDSREKFAAVLRQLDAALTEV